MFREPMSWPKWRTFLVFGIKFSVSALLLYVLFTYIDYAEVVAHLQKADPVLIIFGVLFGWLNLVFSALRWWRIQQYFRVGTDFSFSVFAYAEAVAFNLLLPGSMGGDVVRVVRLGRLVGSYLRAFYSAFVDRLSSFLILILLAAVAWPFLYGDVATVVGYVVGVLLLATIAGFLVVYNLPVDRRFLRIRPYRHLVRFAFAVRRVFSSPVRTGEAMALSLCVQACIVAMMVCAMTAVSADAPSLAIAVLAATLATLAAMVPLTLAGIGLREGAIVWVLQIFGYAGSYSYAVALIFGILALVQCFPGVLVWMFGALDRR